MRANCVRRLCGAGFAAFLCGGAPAKLFAQQTATQVDSATSEAPLVTNVRVVTTDGQDLKVGRNVVTVEPGKPLDREKVAASLKLLYRTGDFFAVQWLAGFHGH